jgi:hypothetical protein
MPTPAPSAHMSALSAPTPSLHRSASASMPQAPASALCTAGCVSCHARRTACSNQSCVNLVLNVCGAAVCGTVYSTVVCNLHTDCWHVHLVYACLHNVRCLKVHPQRHAVARQHSRQGVLARCQHATGVAAAQLLSMPWPSLSLSPLQESPQSLRMST